MFSNVCCRESSRYVAFFYRYMAPNLTALQRSQMAEALTLSRFLTTQSKAADSEVVQRRRDRLRAIQQELQAYVHPINQQPSLPAQIPLPIRQAFVEAALLVSRYFAAGGSGWRGSFDSPTLAQYRSDPVPADWATAAGVAALGDRFALPPPTLDHIVCQLEQVDAEIAWQGELIEAVLQSVGLSTNEAVPLSTEPLASLFQELFGGILVNPDCLAIVFTPSQLYFCVDFPPLEDAHSWERLSPPEHQENLQALYQSLSEFTFQKFKRFPTFGPCDPLGIHRGWVQQICDRLNSRPHRRSLVTPEQVIQRLSKSVGVLPRKDAEMFLVHDFWVHYWHLLFSQVASDYALLADCDEALRADETAYTPEGPLTCRQLFRFVETDVLIDAERALQFFRGEVRQRLGLLFTHLLGELVADIAEFKFVWTNPQSAHQLPSSSAFTDYPANLDLSLADLDFLFLRILQPLLEIHLSPLTPSPLEIELLDDSPWRDLPAAQVPRLELNLKRAIAQLHHIFLTEHGNTCLPSIEAEESLFAEAALNLLQLQNVINTLYTDPQFTEQATMPFQDLMIVFISRYCSGDSYAEFWQIDNVLADYFVPCWQLLHQAS